MTPLESLHDAIHAGAAAVAGAAVESVKLERPPRAELGDYSTNAPLLLAPRLGSAPREVAGGSPASSRRGSARALERDRGRRAGLPQPLPERRVVRRRAGRASSPRASASARARLDRAGADQRRVRLRQPDRPAAHRPRAPGGLRRRARADPRAPRPRRHARVLHQRLRQPGRAARRVGARAGAR